VTLPRARRFFDREGGISSLGSLALALIEIAMRKEDGLAIAEQWQVPEVQLALGSVHYRSINRRGIVRRLTKPTGKGCRRRERLPLQSCACRSFGRQRRLVIPEVDRSEAGAHLMELREAGGHQLRW
jgi:hypothetical protein